MEGIALDPWAHTFLTKNSKVKVDKTYKRKNIYMCISTIL